MLDIQNLTDFPVDRETFSQVAKKVLAGENRETEHVSLVFVDSSEIKKLNKEFRQKDSPTDVLSFNLDEKEHLGEVVICPEVVKQHAVEYGVSVEYETMKVFIHGILHLLGYDHEISEAEERRMFARQDKYLTETNIHA